MAQQARSLYVGHELLGCNSAPDIYYSTRRECLSACHRGTVGSWCLCRVHLARLNVCRCDRMGRAADASQAGGCLLRNSHSHPQVDRRVCDLSYTTVTGFVWLCLSAHGDFALHPNGFCLTNDPFARFSFWRGDVMWNHSVCLVVSTVAGEICKNTKVVGTKKSTIGRIMRNDCTVLTDGVRNVLTSFASLLPE